RDVNVLEETRKEVNLEINPERKKVSVGENCNQEGESQRGSISEESCEARGDSSDEDYVNRIVLEDNVEIRRSNRVPKKKIHEDYVSFFCVNQSGLGEPTTIEDALNGDDSVQWKRAIEDELQSFEENQAWVVADLPEGATCVQNKWVFKKKVDSAGGVKF
ncbi:hypothetical protein QE152_g41506, partial [Popillia japonica]